MKGSTDPHSSSAALLAAFGAAVLDINRLARDKTLERFHRTALERLQQLVPFQRAWWGRAALIDGVPVEHSAHLFNLEEHYVEDWKSISHDDITVGLVHARPAPPWPSTCRPPPGCAGLARVTTSVSCSA